MSRYDAVAARTLKAIEKYGADVTFPGTASGAPGTYNPATDQFTSADPNADATGKAVQIEGDPDRWSSLGLTLSNPVTLMIAASGLSVTPEVGMAIEWAGLAYAIRDVSSVAPDGVPILYTVIADA